MGDNNQKIKEFEEELRNTKYNKRTQHHVGLVKAKIARLKEQQETKIRGKGKTEGYSVRKTGDASAVLVGFPSVGKSTLLNAITNADSKIGSYEFTTLDVVPGLLEYNHAKIQILDVPGLIQGASQGKGRGKEVLAVAKSADMIIVLVDVNNLWQCDIINRELYDAKFRLNKRKADVTIKKAMKGGINISSTVKLSLEKETIRAIMNEFRIINADVLFRQNVDEDELIDVLEANRFYIPALTVINKVDTVSEQKLKEIRNQFKDAVFVSAERKDNTEELKKAIFNKLDFIRVYMKNPGKKADMDEPLIMKRGSKVKDICNKLHRDFVRRFRFARVTGKSAKFVGQKFTLEHVLVDGDILELHLK
jgi:uncharacterized protein